MAKRTILVDSARRELEKHGTETFPMTVNHDDLWSFEGKNVPIHWHNDLEINLIREGEAVFQVYQKSYRVRTGEGFLLNRNVPHSCSSPGNEHVRYSTILVRPDFLYGDFGSDVERKCFQPFLQNSAIPCIYLTGFDENGNPAMDEISNIGKTKVAFIDNGDITVKYITPEDFGLSFSKPEDIVAPETPQEHIQIIYNILNNVTTTSQDRARLDLCLMNSASILYLTKKVDSLEEGVIYSRKLIEDGSAKKQLEKIIKYSNE